MACKHRGQTRVDRRAPEQPPGASAQANDVVAPACVRLYRRAFRSCRTLNQINKLHIDMDNRLTPAEVSELWQWQQERCLINWQAAPEFIESTSRWLKTVSRWMGYSGQPQPQPFERRRLAPALLKFDGPGHRRDKTLLICFTTRGRRLMIPHAALLQHIDAKAHDVLIVADPRRQSFAAGVPLLANSLGGLLQWLGRNIALGEYRSSRALGCSGGGYAAAMAARRLPVELGVSVGGRFPPGQHLLRAWMVIKAWAVSLRNRRATVLLAFGDDKTRDRKFAYWIAGAMGGKQLSTRIPDGEVGHLVLHAVLEQQALGQFLRQSLLAPLPTARQWGRFRTLRFPLQGGSEPPGDAGDSGSRRRNAEGHV